MPSDQNWGWDEAPVETETALLDYEHHPESEFPHWIAMRQGTINGWFYDDVFKIIGHRISETQGWLVENVGWGSRWNEGQEFYPISWEWLIIENRNGPHAVAFKSLVSALHFKMRWG